MLVKRQFSIRWLMLLTAYVGALTYCMTGVVDPPSACVSLIFGSIPQVYLLYTSRGDAHGSWSGVRRSTFQRSSCYARRIYWDFYHTQSWTSSRILSCLRTGCWWLSRYTSDYQRRPHVEDDLLSAALLGAAAFSIIGLVFSYFTRSVVRPTTKTDCVAAGRQNQRTIACSSAMLY